MNADLVHPAKNIVGESLVWDDRQKCLFWVDIVSKKIHALDPVTGDHLHWETPDFVTSIGLRKDGGAIVGLTKRICLWDFGGPFETLAEIEVDEPGNRLNEGVVGPDGAFWVGTMQNNIAPNGSPLDITASTGKLYRCTADGTVTRISDDLFGITNTMIWPDARSFVTADTLENRLYRYERNEETGKLSERAILVDGFDRGLPDGSTLDADGQIWNCRVVDGSCIIRIDQSGTVTKTEDLPCSWPTSCTFGGENLDTLYITSARFTMDDERLKNYPQEGGLFAVKNGITGTPPYRFG